MPIEFRMPDLGENIQTADVGQVLVAEGDAIKAEQVILELETDKAVFELPCPYAGKLVKLHVRPGATVAVGDLIATLESAAADAPAAKAPPPAPTPSVPAPPAPAPAPSAGHGNGALRPSPQAVPRAIESAPIASAPTPKTEAPPAIPMPPAWEPVDEPVIEGRARASAPSSTSTPASAAAAAPAPAGPATRRLARELGVELHHVTGTGPGGRITSEDVQSYVRQALTGGQSKTTSADFAAEAGPLPDFSQFGPIERKPINKIAKTAALNLSLAWRVAPHVTQHELADVTEMEAARKTFAQRNPNSPKVTMTVLALKAVVAALKEFPIFNASFDSAAGEVVLKQYFHIGIAVDTEHGLIVPVIHDVDKKDILALAGEVASLADKARARKLALAELKGGCFTISNLGGIGGTGFTPIINYPEVAILGLSRARWQQTMHEDQPALRLLLPLSVSYDHRVINGADGARFAAKLARLLADPYALLVES